MIYHNSDSDKSQILSDNKERTGIYMQIHIESGKRYIGSAFNLSKRLSKYYSFSGLKEVDNYISRAIIHHTHSAFCLAILEYVDVSNLSKEKARKLILSREQYYLDIIFLENEPNTFNLLKIAGSSLGYIYTTDSITKMSEIQKNIDRSGKNHPMFGKTHSAETKALISEALSGIKNPMFGKIREDHPIIGKKGESNPMFDKSHSVETKIKMSAIKGTIIYVYDSQGSLVNTFNSARKAAEYFDVSKNTIIKYAKNHQIFKENWILSTSLITKE